MFLLSMIYFLTACLTLEDKDALEKEILSTRKAETQLKLENSQLKEVTEVARQQVVAMETRKKTHNLELSSLRHQLLDAQVGSDERTVVGKLHHQVTTLQVSEATLLQRLEAANAKVLVHTCTCTYTHVVFMFIHVHVVFKLLRLFSSNSK